MCVKVGRRTGGLGMCADDFACGGTVEEDMIADGVASHGDLCVPNKDGWMG